MLPARLLEVFPEREEENLEVRLVIVPDQAQSRRPGYTALSHCWGQDVAKIPKTTKVRDIILVHLSQVYGIEFAYWTPNGAFTGKFGCNGERDQVGKLAKDLSGCCSNHKETSNSRLYNTLFVD
jgi:hypothetical protein